jgi:hypothetical protein
MSFGLYLSKYNLAESPLFIALGGGSLYILYNRPDWPGFVGGTGYAAFLACSAPTLIRKATEAVQRSQVKAGTIVGHVFLSYILVALADVWTVAYAFVPGGFLLREKTNM